jgi:dTDP-4-dehydrorhamnose reductase
MGQTILVLGGTGFLGSYLVQELQTILSEGREIKITASTRLEVINLDFPDVKWYQIDVLQIGAIEVLIDKVDPDIIINCIALGAEDCENDATKCYFLNNIFVEKIAQEAKARNISLYHISTSQVFDAIEGACNEEDTPKAKENYGHSKLLGEQHIRNIGNYGSIIRVTTIWGEKLLNHQHSNLILSLRDVIEQNNDFIVFDDQYRSPTYVNQVAKVITSYILSDDYYPIIHVTENIYDTFANFVKKIPGIEKYKNIKFGPSINWSKSKKLGLNTKYPELNKELNLESYLKSLKF